MRSQYCFLLHKNTKLIKVELFYYLIITRNFIALYDVMTMTLSPKKFSSCHVCIIDSGIL